MPRDVHCPNPGCSHVFPAAAVAGVAALVCPDCGGVFQVKRKDPPPAPGRPAAAKRQRGRSAGLVWVVAGLIIFIGLGLMTAALYRPPEAPKPAGPEPFKSADLNYSFNLPGPPWQRDADLAKRLAGVLAFHRSDPDVSVVL